MKGRRVRDVILGLLAVCVAASCAGTPARAHPVSGAHHAHHRIGLAAHLCATQDAVITTHGHRLRTIGRRHYFAPIGQAMYYRDSSHRCQLRRTAHRHS